MIGSVTFEMDRLMKTLKEIQPEMNKGMKTVVKDAAKVVVRKAIEMTPPGSNTVQGQAAKKRGENAIVTDLFGGNRSSKGFGKQGRRGGIFFGVNEAILTKFHDTLGRNQKIKAAEAQNREILFRTKTGEVWATQQNLYRPNASMSEMMAHHRRYFKNGNMTSSISGMVTTGQWVFVDRFVTTKKNLNQFMRLLQKRVGFWAAGWMKAVEKLKVSRVPGWIKRHADYSKGRCPFIEGRDKFTIEIANSTGYGSLKRIVPYALAGARGAMIKSAEIIKARSLAKAGLKK
jgi:hypothetical protein